MKAFKCDRCNKFFEMGRLLTLEGTVIKNVLMLHWYPNKVDICPDCAKRLIAFLEEWWPDV